MADTGNEAERADLLDAISDLGHDLGKHLLLPIALVPADASQAELGAALGQALLRTRTHPAQGVRPARAIWEGFVRECGGPLGRQPAYEALVLAVERALAWERRLGGHEALQRADIEADFGAVKTAIRRLFEEVRGETATDSGD